MARFWSILALTLFLGAAPAAEPDTSLADAEKTLKEAGVGADGPALLAFFKERFVSDEDRDRLRAAVARFGDDNFAVREQATEEVLKAGRIVLPFLRAALRDADPEVVSRARFCLQAIEKVSDLSLTAAAARALADRKPDGAAQALLQFLPLADDEYVQEAIFNALALLALKDGKVDRVVADALADKEPLRRVAAAHVLGRAAKQNGAALRRALEDKDARVRYQAATALLRAGDKGAVPALTGLLGDGPVSLAWQSEDLLFRLAGDKPPSAALTTDDPAARAKCREAWDAWWKANGDKVDLAKLNLDNPLLGLTLICELDGGAQGLGRVWECGLDGKVRWKIETAQGPIAAQALPGGRVLVAEHNGMRITERDREGKVLWEHKVQSNPVSCQRLANGNTLIATYNQLLEVTREGKVVYSMNKPFSIYHAQKLRNGHLLYTTHQNQVIEEETNGKQVRAVPVADTSGWASVQLLPTGNLLVSCYNTSKAMEVDAAGKVLWQCTVQNPTSATRLPNGNTLVTSTEARTVIEFDRNGKEVWKQTTQGRPFHVSRY